MTQDARQSLIALVSVVFGVGFSAVFLRLSKGLDIPDWVLPAGLLLMTVNLVWRGIQWLRSRHNSPEANGS